MANKRVHKLVLCVCGGYQAHSIPAMIVALRVHFADEVQVVMSHSATTLISRDAVEVASRNPVFVAMTDRFAGVYVPHIELTQSSDLTLVFPASVSLLGKVAHGIADTLIPALLLASESPTVIVPVSNERMISHPATQRNIQTLRQDGYYVVNPPEAFEIAAIASADESLIAFPYPDLLSYMLKVADATL